MDKKYKNLVSKYTPKENVLYNALIAFIVGGFMGMLGQALLSIYTYVFNISTSDASILMIVTLVFLGCLLTCLGFFDKWVNFARCGLIVPITGFANSIVSPAMEYKSEGYVMGVGGKMFTVAGPVLVFGISASILVGLVYLIFNTQAITLV